MAMSRGGGGGMGAPVGGGVSWNKPRALVCHICGREYGTTSLAIHLPQCQKMWIQRESLKPKNERRPVPAAPAGIGGPVPRGQKGIDAYNERAFTAFTDKTLVACPHCGRKFLEDRLKVHLRSCRPGNEAKPVKGKSGPTTTNDDDDDMATSSPPPRTAGGGGGAGRPSLGGRAPTMGGGAGAPRRVESKSAPGDDIPIGRSSSNGGGGGMGMGNGGFGGSIPAGADDGPPMEMAECSICHRRFAADRLAKHEAVCATHTAKEAKVKAKLAAKEAKKPKPAASDFKGEKPNWKAKHDELRNAMRQARKISAVIKAGGDIRDLPPPPPSINPDYIQCPTCGRRYNETAAARHIPKCKDIINKPKPPPRAVVPSKRAPPPAAGQRTPAATAPGARRTPGSAGGFGGMGNGAGDPRYASASPNGDPYGATYGGMSRNGVGGGGGGMGMGSASSLTTPPRTAGGNGLRSPLTSGGAGRGTTGQRSPMGGRGGGAPSATANGGFPPIRPPSGGNGRNGATATFGSPAASRFCENCGAARTSKANFCGGCGQRH